MEYDNSLQIKWRIQKTLIALSNKPNLTVAMIAREFFLQKHDLR